MEEEALVVRFGALVRRLRTEKGYSQERFAEVCRIDRSYMGMIERGEVSVTLTMIAKLADGLDLSLAALFLKLEREPKDSDADSSGNTGTEEP
jgi:transcriptional regulator with XRE-family HTH domain